MKLRRNASGRAVAILALAVLTASAFVTLVVPAATRAATVTTVTGTALAAATSTSQPQQQLLLFDDFTVDASLNTNLWQLNGPVGSDVGTDDVGSFCTLLGVEPTFSSSGMEISETNKICQGVSIQSILSFAPPFNATAVVEGTVSNGHTFGLAMASADASSGVLVYGNLNPDNCSNLGDCGDPSTCGNPYNSSISPGQCYYGIDVKTGNGGQGGWSSAPKLYLTPSVDVLYTVQILVSASGSAKLTISQGGNLLGRSTATVGTGPFYLIMEQAEGLPVPGKGPNQAYWQSVSLTSSPSSLSVYPTEPSYAYLALTYPQSLASNISVAVVKGPNFPQGLTVTIRPKGATTFNGTLNIKPSSSGSTTIQVNATLNCVVGNCMQPGGTQLPLNYNVTITAAASGGGYTQDITMPLQLLKAKWLIMLYANCDTKLEENIRGNVLEMVSESKVFNNPAVGMLVLFYGYNPASFPGNNVQEGGTTALYEIANGTMRQVGSLWPTDNLFDPATLHKFLTTSMAMVPANHTQLIIADHGGGIEGVPIWGGGVMSIPQLATALTGISPRLDILSFDACLMAQIDALYQLRNYAASFTASERTIPGPGYNYVGMLNSLLQDPDQSTASYLQVIVSTYGAKYTSLGVVGDLAAINSSQLAAVVSGLNTLSSALVSDYGQKNGAFNTTMLSLLKTTVSADAGRPYLDIVSLAQGLLSNPGITDQNIKTAATALIQDVNGAVIANTTPNTGLVYAGLTVLLFPRANVDKQVYQVYARLDAQLSFPSAANWFPLLQSVNRSAPAPSVIVITLDPPSGLLYLKVYNSTGGFTGYDPALLNMSREAIEVMPGSSYLDFNGTTVISLPSSMQNFMTVVDGTSLTGTNESYALTYTVVQNGTVTSTKLVQGTINQDTLQSTNVTVQNGVLAIGSTTTSTTSTTSSTTSNTSTTSSTTSATPPVTSTTSSTASTTSSVATSSTSVSSATSSVTSTTSSSSTSPASSSSFPTTYVLVGVLLVVVIVVAIALLARRRAAR